MSADMYACALPCMHAALQCTTAQLQMAMCMGLLRELLHLSHTYTTPLMRAGMTVLVSGSWVALSSTLYVTAFNVLQVAVNKV